MAFVGRRRPGRVRCETMAADDSPGSLAQAAGGNYDFTDLAETAG